MGDAIADEEMGIWDWMLGWRLPDSCGLQRVSVFIINANKNKEEELCSDELTVGRRNDGTGLSDAAAASADERPVDARDGSELRGLDGGLPVPLLLLGRVPSLDRSDGRVAMGACFLCIAKRSGRICQLYLQEFTR